MSYDIEAARAALAGDDVAAAALDPKTGWEAALKEIERLRSPRARLKIKPRLPEWWELASMATALDGSSYWMGTNRRGEMIAVKLVASPSGQVKAFDVDKDFPIDLDAFVSWAPLCDDKTTPAEWPGDG